MVIIKPLKLLVCLPVALLTLIYSAADIGWAYNDLSGNPGIQGDALSAEPKMPSSQQVRSRGAVRTPNTSTVYSGPPRIYSQAPVPKYTAGNPAPPGAVCPPAAQPSFLGSFPGMGFGGGTCAPPFLPRMGCSRFQLAARLWYVKLNGSTALWGTNLAGGPGTELDLHNNLGLSKYQYLGDYEAQCQVKYNWGLRAAFTPINYRNNFIPQMPFFFGNTIYPAFTSTLTKWDRFIYRAYLTYDWFKQPHAISTIYAGYTQIDDKLAVSNFFQNRARSQAIHLASAGIGFERFIRYLGASVVSTNCRATVDFLEGYVGWDGYAAARISVPMNQGRWGYLEAGWRWLVLENSQPTNIDKTSMDGFMGAVGLIF
ncbi:MAG: hypothetical protein HY912_11715 [Desulfomonile tiedjei]|uniref:Outer membrane beta-barrel protein n=1 Tax=Desulfomonile tiedjei TaxID=2358 RepID=A0A9D6V552_9BACT|nr:hypothetical protein [Desulfomonile tiedjei]